MDRYLEAFDAAEQARIQGDYGHAIELYTEAAGLADQSSAADLVALHHMWGVALKSAGQYEEALTHLRKASTLADTTRNSKTWAAIDRDLALLYLTTDSHGMAWSVIEKSLSYTTANDLAERGASLGAKARILLARGRINDALEHFGTADVLLQRSGNHHYELYNLMHFLEAIIEHRLPFFEDNWADVEFAEAQTPRLRALADTYGGPPHQERVTAMVSDIFAERDC